MLLFGREVGLWRFTRDSATLSQIVHARADEVPGPICAVGESNGILLVAQEVDTPNPVLPDELGEVPDEWGSWRHPVAVFWRVDPTTGSWQAVPHTPFPRGCPAIVGHTDGSFSVIGGKLDEWDEAYPIHRLAPDGTTWSAHPGSDVWLGTPARFDRGRSILPLVGNQVPGEYDGLAPMAFAYDAAADRFVSIGPAVTEPAFTLYRTGDWVVGVGTYLESESLETVRPTTVVSHLPAGEWDSPCPTYGLWFNTTDFHHGYDTQVLPIDDEHVLLVRFIIDDCGTFTYAEVGDLRTHDWTRVVMPALPSGREAVVTRVFTYRGSPAIHMVEEENCLTDEFDESETQGGVWRLVSTPERWDWAPVDIPWEIDGMRRTPTEVSPLDDDHILLRAEWSGGEDDDWEDFVSNAIIGLDGFAVLPPIPVADIDDEEDSSRFHWTDGVLWLQQFEFLVSWSEDEPNAWHSLILPDDDYWELVSVRDAMAYFSSDHRSVAVDLATRVATVFEPPPFEPEQIVASPVGWSVLMNGNRYALFDPATRSYRELSSPWLAGAIPDWQLEAVEGHWLGDGRFWLVADDGTTAVLDPATSTWTRRLAALSDSFDRQMLLDVGGGVAALLMTRDYRGSLLGVAAPDSDRWLPVDIDLSELDDAVGIVVGNGHGLMVTDGDVVTWIDVTPASDE